MDIDSNNKVSIGMSCIIRIHLKDGTYHDVRKKIKSTVKYKTIYTYICIYVYIIFRILDMELVRIIKQRQVPMKKRKRKLSLMHLKDLFVYLVVDLEIVLTTKSTLKILKVGNCAQLYQNQKFYMQIIPNNRRINRVLDDVNNVNTVATRM